MRAMKMVIVGAAAVCVAVACGGSKPKPAEEPPGTSHEGGGPEVTGELGVGPGPGGPGGAAAPDAGVGGARAIPAPLPDAGPPPPPYTFEINNTGASELHFALDKGWQTALFAYTGKPPKAKSVLLFPTWCTESCDADVGAMCPVCKEPKEPKDIKKWEKAETKREVVAAGGTFKLEWDGKVYVYEKAPKEAAKKKKSCQCWRKVDAAPETYTVKACGLRPDRTAGKSSTPMCAESQMTVPGPSPATTVRLDFPDPPAPKKKGK
jgi:hypothetical protein